MNRIALAAAFRAAKGIVSKGARHSSEISSINHFICCALDEAAKQKLIPLYVAEGAQKVVQDRMRLDADRRTITLESWLERVGAIPDAGKVDCRQMQMYRHRCLTHSSKSSASLKRRVSLQSQPSSDRFMPTVNADTL